MQAKYELNAARINNLERSVDELSRQLMDTKLSKSKKNGFHGAPF